MRVVRGFMGMVVVYTVIVFVIYNGIACKPKTMSSYSQYYGQDYWRTPAIRSSRWRYIIVHHSATDVGCARSFDRYHRMVRKWKNGLGYHFVIGNGTKTPDGFVEAGHRWYYQLEGAHAGVAKYNQHGIGICLVGNFNKTYPTERQMHALVTLVKQLHAEYGIPYENVLPHRAIKPTDCPGNNFPWEQFMNELYTW